MILILIVIYSNGFIEYNNQYDFNNRERKYTIYCIHLLVLCISSYEIIFIFFLKKKGGKTVRKRKTTEGEAKLKE